jgi:hypothetical protein
MIDAKRNGLDVNNTSASKTDRRELHRQRTVQGIAASREKGTMWGATGKAVGLANRSRAEAYVAILAPLVLAIIAAGCGRPRLIARRLQTLGVPSSMGADWCSKKAQRLLARIDSEAIKAAKYGALGGALAAHKAADYSEQELGALAKQTMHRVETFLKGVPEDLHTLEGTSLPRHPVAGLSG